MRIHAGLPKVFWADAINTAAYLINRGPSIALNFRIPEEVWSEKGEFILFKGVWLFLAYVHIDAAARNKLDAKSQKCYFIGYGDTEFGYRFWDDKN